MNRNKNRNGVFTIPILQLKDVRKSFPVDDTQVHVLKGISLKFKLGEFVSIVGESGVGKSTLMNIIGGLDSDYSGEVMLDGDSLKDYSQKDLNQYRRKEIGFVFQDFHLIGHLTVLGNVLVPLEMTSRNSKAKLKRAKKLLYDVGLSSHMNSYPSELSGGQKQRVAIARALASDPRILIADEPTGALDQKNTDEILKILEKVAQDGKLVLTVTHSHRVAQYGSRIVHITNGKVDEDKHLHRKFDPKTPILDKFKHHPLPSRSLWKMTADNIKRHPGQNILTIIGGMIGLLSVLLILGLGTGAKGYINSQITSEVNPDVAMITHHDRKSTAPFKSSDMRRIKRVKGVKNVTGGMSTGATQFSYRNHHGNVQSISNELPFLKPKDLKYGRMPKKHEILLSSTLAKQLTKQPKTLVGKTVKANIVPAENSHKGVSAMNGGSMIKGDLKVAGISKLDSNTSATYGTLKQIYQKNNWSSEPQYLNVRFKGGVGQDNSAQKSIKSLKQNGKPLYSSVGSSDMLSKVNVYLNLAVAVLAGLAAISLLVSAVMIIAILFISVNERTKEIGILRALGASKKNIRHLFLDQALLLGLISSVMATIISYMNEALINIYTDKSIGYSLLQITPAQIITVIVITLIINAVASILPSWKASRLDPIKCLNK